MHQLALQILCMTLCVYAADVSSAALLCKTEAEKKSWCPCCSSNRKVQLQLHVNEEQNSMQLALMASKVCLSSAHLPRLIIGELALKAGTDRQQAVANKTGTRILIDRQQALSAAHKIKGPTF